MTDQPNPTTADALNGCERCKELTARTQVLAHKADDRHMRIAGLERQLKDSEGAVIRREQYICQLEQQLSAKTAEVEGLRKDAERYRWLRHGDNDEKIIEFSSYADREGCGHDDAWLLRRELLDSAIDAAIQQQAEKEGGDE